jgi:hypothetical protein
MSKLLATTIALGLATAYVAPVLAADKAPTTKSECQKEHMKWDASTKTCAPKGGGYW